MEQDVLERRLRQLRAIGAYPAHGRPLVVEVSASTLAQIDELCDVPSALEVVLFSTSPENDELVDAMRESLGRRAYIVDSNATVEDVATAIANARAVVGTSPDCVATALSFGIPHGATFSAAWNARAKGPSAVVETETEMASLRRAHQSLREKLAAERALFAEAVNRFGEGDRSVASLVNENAWIHQQYADARNGRAVAEQRADAAEQAVRELETRLETALEESVALREELNELRRRLDAASADLASVREELTRVRAENERHRLVFETKIVSAALRVQHWIVRLKRR